VPALRRGACRPRPGLGRQTDRRRHVPDTLAAGLSPKFSTCSTPTPLRCWPGEQGASAWQTSECTTRTSSCRTRHGSKQPPSAGPSSHGSCRPTIRSTTRPPGRILAAELDFFVDIDPKPYAHEVGRRFSHVAPGHPGLGRYHRNRALVHQAAERGAANGSTARHAVGTALPLVRRHPPEARARRLARSASHNQHF